MKILLTWELDADPAHLHYLKLIAGALRAQHVRVSIILATNQPVLAKDVEWADEVYLTSRVKFKHANAATGVLASLNQLGWTAPDLRSFVFSGWAQLYRELKPDAIVAHSSPGALLSAVLEEIPVIQSSHGFHMVSTLDEGQTHLFPELHAWIEMVANTSLVQLLARPGIVFSPSVADLPRMGLVFHCSGAQWPWQSAQRYEEPVMLAPGSYSTARVRSLLAEAGIQTRVIDPSQGYQVHQGQLLLGDYHRQSVCAAVQAGTVYAGIDPSERDKDFALRCDKGRISVRLGALGDTGVIEAVDMLLANAQRHRPESAVASFSELPIAISMLSRFISC